MTNGAVALAIAGLAAAVLAISRDSWVGSIRSLAPLRLKASTREHKTANGGQIELVYPVARLARDAAYINSQVESMLREPISTFSSNDLMGTSTSGPTAAQARVTISCTYKSRGFLSLYACTSSIHPGAANAYHHNDARVIDRRRSAVVDLADVFASCETGTEQVSKYLDEVGRQMGEGALWPERSASSGAEHSAFYFLDDFFVETFPKYAIAPGFAGALELYIPWRSIAHALQNSISQEFRTAQVGLAPSLETSPSLVPRQETNSSIPAKRMQRWRRPEKAVSEDG